MLVSEDINCCIYFPLTKTYTQISSSVEYRAIINGIILFDLSYPYFIEIRNDEKLFESIVEKLNYDGDFIKKSINLNKTEREFNIDSCFSISNDFSFLNYNLVGYSPDTKKAFGIKRTNLKLFMFKNVLIFYTLKKIEFIKNIFTNSLKFKFIEDYQIFFQINKNKNLKVERFMNKKMIIYENNEQEDYLSDCENENILTSCQGIKRKSRKKSKFATVKTLRHIDEFKSEISQRIESQLNTQKKIKESNFSLISFYTLFFTESLKNLESYVADLNLIGEELKSSYLDIDMNKIKEFHSRILHYEESVRDGLELIHIKEKLFIPFMNSSHKNIIKTMSFVQFCKQNNKVALKKFKQKLKFLIEGLMGRIYELQYNLEKQVTTFKMIKQSTRILYEDYKYKNSSRLKSITLVVFAILSLVEDPAQYISGLMAMNIRNPFTDVDSYGPFFMIISIITFVSLGQIYVLRKLY
jgi:hypothetical protein